MTVSEMHTLFKLKLDKTNSLNYPDFEPEEIDLWLNQAQEMFVKNRYDGNNMFRTSVEETQKRSDDLREIVRQDMITTFALNSGMTNSYVSTYSFSLPSDYLFSLTEEFNGSYVCEGSTLTADMIVKPIQHNAWTTMMKDPFNKPNKDRVLRLMNNNFIDVILDKDTTPIFLFIRYYKTPVNIDNTPTNLVDCELAAHTHSEIVDFAVLMAIENIESDRIKTAPFVSSKIE